MKMLLNRQHKIISKVFLKQLSLTGKNKLSNFNTILDTKAHMFQYKVLHNILYADKMLFKFKKVTSLQYSFYKLHDETTMHLFYDCFIVKRIWNQLKSILSNNLTFLISMPECRYQILGFRSE